MKIHKYVRLDVHKVHPPPAAPKAIRVYPPPATRKATMDDTTVGIAEGDRTGEVALYGDVSSVATADPKGSGVAVCY